jgi:hypothetical protein
LENIRDTVILPGAELMSCRAIQGCIFTGMNLFRAFLPPEHDQSE